MDWNNINRDRDTSGLGPIEYDQSKVPALIRKHADYVRTKTYGQEVREAQARNAELAGLIANEAVDISNETKERQDTVETQFNSVQQELTDKDPISAPEIIAARMGESTLSARLEKDQQEVTAQLAHKVSFVKNIEEMLEIDTPKDNQLVFIESYYTNSEYGGGTFKWDESLSSSLHDGGMYIDRQHQGVIGTRDWYSPQNENSLGVWRRIYEGDVFLDYYGVKKDKSQDVSYIVRNAIDYASRKNTSDYVTENTLVEPIHITAGNYLVERTIHVTEYGHMIKGDGESTKLFGNVETLGEDNPMINIDLTVSGYFNIENIMFIGDAGGTNTIHNSGYIPRIVGVKMNRVSHSTKGPLAHFHGLSFYGFKVGVIFTLGWLVEFSNCSFIGSTTNNRVGSGIYLGRTLDTYTGVYNSVNIYRCNFQNLSYGVWGNYGRNLNVDNCSFENINTGVFYSKVQGGVVSNSYFEVIYTAGVRIGETSTANPIRISYATANIVVENNTIQGASTLALVRGVYKLTIKNNHQQGTDNAESREDILGSTVVIAPPERDNEYKIIDSYVEFYKGYRMLSIPQSVNMNSIFVDLTVGMFGNENSFIEGLANKLFKRIDNSNGTAYQFIDGTQICTNTEVVASETNQLLYYDYPKPFINEVSPIVTGLHNTSGDTFYSSKATARFGVQANSTRKTSRFSYIAIGRWK